MTDYYEEQYRKETGKNSRGAKDSYFEKWYNDGFVNWLIKQLSDRDKLLALSEARFRAGEVLKKECETCDLEYNCYEDCQYWANWKQSIKNYEEEAGK